MEGKKIDVSGSVEYFKTPLACLPQNHTLSSLLQSTRSNASVR